MIAPGDLVFSCRMSNHCGSGYAFTEEGPKITGEFDTFTGMAMVVAVIVPASSSPVRRGIIAILLPRSQRIVFTWTTSVWEGPE